VGTLRPTGHCRRRRAHRSYLTAYRQHPDDTYKIPQSALADLISALSIPKRESIQVPHLVLGAVAEGPLRTFPTSST
jgi:hypothetical protein